MSRELKVRVAATSDVLREMPGSRLSPAELALVRSKKRTADRADALAARALLHSLLESDDRVIHLCDRCGGPHGRPRLVDDDTVGLSIAHADGWVAAAVAPGRVGVDVESVAGLRRLISTSGVVRSMLTAEEITWVEEQAAPAIAFGHLWTRKEALVKAGFADIDAMAQVPVIEVPDGWLFEDHSVLEGHGVQVSAVAWVARPIRV